MKIYNKENVNMTIVSKVMYIWGFYEALKKLDETITDINNILEACTEVAVDWANKEDLVYEEEKSCVEVYAERVLIEKYGRKYNNNPYAIKNIGLFEKEIAKSLTEKYHYSEEQAFNILCRFFYIVIQTNLYLNADEWAEQLDFVIKNNITEEQWMAQIKKINREITRNYRQ